ncbi:MAG TPA: CHAT domain-containing tetratricopeptide repeat protein, partial [Gemmata sp.]
QQLGQHAQAMACYERAEPLLAASGQPFERALLRMMVGMVLRHAGDYEGAVRAGTEAVQLFDGAGRAFELATALMNLSTAELELGRTGDAIAHAARALELLEEHGGGAQTEHARMGLAHALVLSGELARGLEQYRRVDLRLCGGEPRLRFHFGNALALLQLGQREAGLDHLRRAVAAYHQTREEAGASELAMEFIGRRSLLGEGAVSLALDAGAPELAFELGQAGKGVLSQEFLGTAAPALRLDTPNVLEARRHLVGHFLFEHDGHRYPAPEHDPGTLLHAYLSECRAAELVAREARPAPRGAEPGYVLGAVQGALRPGWAVIDLWQLSGGELRVFVVTRDRFRVVPIQYEPTGEFARRLELLFARIAAPDRLPDGWHAAGADRVWDNIYAALFRPLEPVLAEFGVTGLYLVPHSWWHGVPLHAARCQVVENGRKVSRYLYEKFAVAYLPSAAALPHLPPPRLPTRCLSLANPDHGTSTTLPFAEWEAAHLGNTFAGSGNRFFARDRATVAAADWAGADFLHFGCHGTGDPAFAGASRLFLAGDCLLAHDVIYRRPALAPGCTVVLNGCQTGVKDRRAVDEGLGLMTAFLLRGAGIVLATQWNVPDHFAARVVTAFAEELTAGALPTAALARAIGAARRLSAADVSEDAGAVALRFPADRHPFEAARVQALRDPAAEAAARPGTPGGYDDPFIWAVFQLTGRAI